ncbi:hypothetical protein Riv7116_4919 [Rivularia sp. PCC 7116]|uniref:hypothetical protein n=1 Tax=Rivularia sp. PCC 7116 TaxID=373994 RepID=UPI00029EFA37|nr:hypothetical protein [Rivularia sp. PCC 7116]AFY57328.1 hypothetical protein Riv7116_4919 [Rivularia sp. PCC 7116]
MKTPICANFVLQSAECNDTVFIVTTIEENIAIVEVQDGVENLLGVLELTIEQGRVIAKIIRVGYQEKPIKIQLCTL